MPIEEPRIVISIVDVGLGLKLMNRPLHLGCVGHYRAEKQAMMMGYISLFVGLISLGIAVIR